MTEVTPLAPATQGALWSGEAKPLQPIYDHPQMIAAAVEHWRRAGFPYRSLSVVECMDQINRLSLADDDALVGTDAAYHVADTYHPHRFSAAAAGMKAPRDAWDDDALLARTVRLLLENDQPITGSSLLGKLAIVSGVQACANFRPGFAVAMYRRFARPGAAILDTSSGYGGRLVGYMASGIHGRYVGIDPSIESCRGNIAMAAALGFGEQVTQSYGPAEDTDPNSLIDAAGGYFDFAFTSPPYFTKERYARGHGDEDLQSWFRYPDAAMWRTGFLQPMLDLQFEVLREGAYSVLNVADVKVGAHVYEVSEWTREAAVRAGFVIEDTISLALTRRYGRSQGSELSSEPALVLRKGGTQSTHRHMHQLAISGEQVPT